MGQKKYIRNLILSFGFAESCQMSGLLISRKRGFSTPSGIIGALLGDSADVMKAESGRNGLCTLCSDIKTRPNTNFCSLCGSNIGVLSRKITTTDISNFIKCLQGSIDSIGSDTLDAMAKKGWNVGGLVSGDALFIGSFEYFISHVDYGCHTMARFTLSDFSEVESPTPDWLDSVIKSIG